MAKKAAPKAKAQKPAKQGASLKPLLWVIFVALIMVIYPESILLLFVGLLPTLVAFIVDKTPKKYATFCVGGMNLTGVFPALMKLWEGQNNIPFAIEILTNIFDLVIMFAAASFGWLLYIAIPPVVKALLAVVSQHRITLLRTRQRELIKEWGESIVGRPRDSVTASNIGDDVPPPPPG